MYFIMEIAKYFFSILPICCVMVVGIWVRIPSKLPIWVTQGFQLSCNIFYFAGGAAYFKRNGDHCQFLEVFHSVYTSYFSDFEFK